MSQLKRRPLAFSTRKLSLLSAAAGVTLLATGTSLHAASGNWSATAATNDWGTSTNWNSSTIAGTTTMLATVTDTATFSASTQLTVLPDLNRTIGTFTFSGTAGNYTIGVSNGNTLYLAGNGSGGATANSSGTNNTITFAGPLSLLTTYQFLSSSANTSNTMLLSSNISSAATSGTTDLQLKGTNTGANTASGVISNGSSGAIVSLTKLNAGSWIVSGQNTFTSKTTIGQGNLSVSSLNYITTGTWSTHTASNLGAPTTVANGTIALGGTTNTAQLTYTGSGETTDRVLNLAGTTGSGILDQSGSGLLKFTANMTATGAGAKTFTLQGSTAGTGEMAGFIRDNSATNKTSLVKAGSGKWTLSAANIYTVTTNITGGTLALATSNTLQSATGDLSVSGGLLTSTLSSTTLGGNMSIGSGEISANGSSIGDFTLASGKNFSMSGGTLTESIASSSSFDKINASGSATFAITGGTLDLTGSTLDYSQTYGILSGFSSGSVSNLSIIGYDTATYTAALSNTGNLSFAVIPEPATLSLLLGVTSLGLLSRRRRVTA